MNTYKKNNSDQQGSGTNEKKLQTDIESSQKTSNDMGADITREDVEILSNLDKGADSGNDGRVYLDNTDNDGAFLNEKSSRAAGSGDDLDVPGAELDDEEEAIGGEDEENNIYSEADTD